MKKALYGLKQSPRAWFSHLSSRLLALGFHGSQSDSSLFICHSAAVTIYFLIYVDNLIVTASQPSVIDDLLHHLQLEFAIKDLDNLDFFLGVEVLPNSTGLLLSQKRYILDLLGKTRMLEAKSLSSPMASSINLSAFEGDPLPDATLYRSTVGALQYLSLTRPGINFTVNKLSQFMHRPTTIHWQAVKRLLHYLKQSIHFGLQLKRSKTHSLQVFSNADWAGCRDDRCSTGGFCVFLGDNLISWGCRKQKTIARSSTKVEYKALTNAAIETKWLYALLFELGTPVTCSPVLWCDNIGATYLSSNPVFHARTKHVEIDFQFVQDMVVDGSLVVRFLANKDQLVDVFTKPLSLSWFALLRTNLNVLPTRLSLRGSVKDKVDSPNDSVV